MPLDRLPEPRRTQDDAYNERVIYSEQFWPLTLTASHRFSDNAFHRGD